MDILDTIIENKKREVAKAKTLRSVAGIKEEKYFGRKTYSLKNTLQSQSGIIAEYKRKSPSKGVINHHSHCKEVVLSYQKYGASAVSILTDPHFFGGNTEDILDVRDSLILPILRKDFMIDEYQFFQSKAMGADIVLLIASCLSPVQVAEFTSLAHELGLEVLLEIHSEEELAHLDKNVDFVGINNRNLGNFKVDLRHSADLKNKLPKDVLCIAESGICSTDDFLFLKEKGFDGFLMGEYFMGSEDPKQKFKEFIENLGI
ncbi:MAG: indole-3-glycerol phosphate synthase TrpC [Bergeyella sp.]|nr:indole-3-glycerol phosphate synthase TrpC [Bergeyella sp.]